MRHIDRVVLRYAPTVKIHLGRGYAIAQVYKVNPKTVGVILPDNNRIIIKHWKIVKVLTPSKVKRIPGVDFAPLPEPSKWYFHGHDFYMWKPGLVNQFRFWGEALKVRKWRLTRDLVGKPLLEYRWRGWKSDADGSAKRT